MYDSSALSHNRPPQKQSIRLQPPTPEETADLFSLEMRRPTHRLTEMDESFRSKEQAQEIFNIILGEIEGILEEQPLEKMWFYVTKYLIHLRRELENYHPTVRVFVENHLEMVLDVLRDQANWKGQLTADSTPSDQTHIRSIAAEEALHHIANELKEKRHETQEVHVLHLSWDEILHDKEHFRMEKKMLHEGEADEIIVNTLYVRTDTASPWNEFIVPPNRHVMHKGGISRTVLKIFAGAAPDMIAAELPPNDIDVVACGNKVEAQRLGLAMGADTAGIEMVENFDDIKHLLRTRDVDLNQAFLTHDGLVFSEAALRSARTGRIEISAEDRGIYGSENFHYQTVNLIKNRGLFRLMKMVIEGKARSFDLAPLNCQVDLGVYWLVLARKLAKKKQGGEFLERAFELGKHLGQVREGERTIYDVLDRVHEEFPFFNFDAAEMDEADHIRWLARKLFRVVQHAFRVEQRIPSGLELTREPFDTVPFSVSLFTYQSDPSHVAVFRNEWPAFLERCQRRTQLLGRKETPEERLRLAS